MARLYGQELSAIDLRSEKRVPFLYPASVTYSEPFQASPLADTGNRETAQDEQLEVVMTDLSVDGAGILVSGGHAPLPPRVILAVDGLQFVCNVRWTKHIGATVYRYGLGFRRVLETWAQTSRTVALRTDTEQAGLVGGASGIDAGKCCPPRQATQNSARQP